MRRILCLNGPNLNRLGTRQPEVYGATTLAELEGMIEAWGSKLGLEVSCVQSNSATDLVEAIHSGTDFDGIIFNPGAFTHYSHAIGDAIGSIDTPVVEVHISNVRERHRWRHRSVVAANAVHTIFGRGLEGYKAALRHLVNRAAWPVVTERYGPHPDQVIDYRLDTSTDAAAVLIHGGFYLDAWGRDSVETWAVDLARRGVSSAVIGYRLMGSGGNPVATTSDISEAMAAARALLPSGPLAVIGHSAGAHLAVWNLSHTETPPDVTVAVSGFFDLHAGSRLGDGAVARFDPTGSLDLSTRTMANANLILVHGAADTVVPEDQSVDLHRRLTESGLSVSLERLADSGHFDLLDAHSPGWQTVARHLADRGVGK